MRVREPMAHAPDLSGTEVCRRIRRVFTLEPFPGSGDEVIVQRGARVFLALEAVMLLTDTVLDARVEETSVEFRIAKRSGPR